MIQVLYLRTNMTKLIDLKDLYPSAPREYLLEYLLTFSHPIHISL